MPRHPPHALKRLIYAQKKILCRIKFLLNIHLFEYWLIVPILEQSDIDIDNIKIFLQNKITECFLVEDSGIEPLTS